MKRVIEERFGVVYAERSISKLLADLGFVSAKIGLPCPSGLTLELLVPGIWALRTVLTSLPSTNPLSSRSDLPVARVLSTQKPAPALQVHPCFAASG